MEQTLVELGLGGGLAILVLREVFAYLRIQKQQRAEEMRVISDPPVDKLAGDRSVEYWQAEINASMSSQLQAVVIPPLRAIQSNQERIMTSQNESRNRMIELSTRMVTTLEQIRDELRSARERDRS